MSVFIVEDMPRAVEELVAELWRRHPTMTVYRCDTPASAQRMLGKFWEPGDIIILDRDDGLGGSFHEFVPNAAWPRVISISVNAGGNEFAFIKRAAAIIPKDYKDLAGWSAQVAKAITKLLAPSCPAGGQRHG